LKAGLSHDTFCKLYTDIVQMFKPEVTVLCAGLDGLVGDPLGDWQLELRSFLHVAKSFTKGLILGGGRCRNNLPEDVATKAIHRRIQYSECGSMLDSYGSGDIAPSYTCQHP